MDFGKCERGPCGATKQRHIVKESEGIADAFFSQKKNTIPSSGNVCLWMMVMLKLLKPVYIEEENRF